MMCLRLRLPSLLLVLFLSLATLGGSIAITRQAIQILADSHNAVAASEVAEELRVEAEGKWSKGRKMGMRDALKCENYGGKKKLNVECEVRVRTSSPSNVELVGLIPFSSDYHAPKTHPPKNN